MLNLISESSDTIDSLFERRTSSFISDNAEKALFPDRRVKFEVPLVYERGQTKAINKIVKGNKEARDKLQKIMRNLDPSVKSDSNTVQILRRSQSPQKTTYSVRCSPTHSYEDNKVLQIS